MKNKILVTILVTTVLVIASVLAFNAYAAGQANDVKKDVQAQQRMQTASTVNQDEENQIKAQNQEEAEVENENENDNQLEKQNQKKNQEQEQEQGQGQITAQSHRSAVANYVQSLLQIADREGGIGQQVRVIAQEQNQSASTTVQAMEKIQTRSKVKTFFFGTDYKNLGALRSEMVQTRNRLEQLNRLLENVQNEEDKTELQNQIQTLEQEQVKIENFIKDQEGKFSLFGWAVKLFQ